MRMRICNKNMAGWCQFLKDQQDNELRWPFDEKQLLEFINL